MGWPVERPAGSERFFLWFEVVIRVWICSLLFALTPMVRAISVAEQAERAGLLACREINLARLMAWMRQNGEEAMLTRFAADQIRSGRCKQVDPKAPSEVEQTDGLDVCLKLGSGQCWWTARAQRPANEP
jgi:hypothetical protein